jgi:hypothetical protein
VRERRGRRRKQLLDDLMERRGYCILTEEALDRTLCITDFRIGCGPVVRHDGMNEYCNFYAYHFYVFKILIFKTFQWGGVIPTPTCWAYFFLLWFPGDGTPVMKP